MRPNFRRFRFKHLQTSITVLVEDENSYEKVVKNVLEARAQVERAIAKEPLFYSSLEPLPEELWPKQEVPRRMCEASKLAGVGPMAAVAGGIAQYAVERFGGRVVIDNGGDIVMRCNRLIAGIFPSELGVKLEFDREKVYSVCTSSGRYGHSISFGDCDAAVILAEDGFVADSFATALGNEIKPSYGAKEIEETLRHFWRRAKRYIDGAVVLKDGYVGVAGEVKLVKANFDERLITR